MLYLAAFAAALLVDPIPVFAPPAWTILAFMIIKWKLNPWGIIAAGALGSVIGRYILRPVSARRSVKRKAATRLSTRRHLSSLSPDAGSERIRPAGQPWFLTPDSCFLV